MPKDPKLPTKKLGRKAAVCPAAEFLTVEAPLAGDCGRLAFLIPMQCAFLASEKITFAARVAT